MTSKPSISERYESTTMHSAPGARVRIGSDEYDYFCGTSYLGLHGHPDLANAVCQAVTSFGTGPATTRAGYGLTPMISAVEENAASYFGSESALYFSSGYLGAAILLQSLSGHYDHIFVDAESHYAIRDGIALSRKPYTTFMHCSVDDLEQNMRTHLKSGQTPLVISDGVFPVTGRMAPLQAYHQVLLSHRRGLLCIDDAHGLGVLGEHGRGSLEYCGVASSGRFAYGTLSKAFGGYGGIISGSAAFIDQIKKGSAIPYACSSVPTPIAAATAAALNLVAQNPQFREQLIGNVNHAKSGFRQLGFGPIPDTPVPIISLSGGGLDCAAIQQQLLVQGIAVQYNAHDSYTAVPKGGALRIALSSLHTGGQIDYLLKTIAGLL